MRTVLVPAIRLARWLENFESRHGPYTLAMDPLTATAEDGSVATITGPFDTPVTVVPPVLPELAWGLLIVRKGGFAVTAGTTPTPTVRKIGRRHVQGRSKAGGQSQQRFARRRDNQARDAYAAAADHAFRILVQEHPIEVLVCGGDRTAIDTVLADPRLRGLVDKVTGPWLDVPDPNAAILARAVEDAWSCRVHIEESSVGDLP
ncbi:MAG TPA: acVLRF1 family peptidyl-tRNA hydrolase [Nocardioidaceae bacterium]|nr:acVLRF1 family peptidyl-tRNA hydrolase [Nocardioidaceae bacterium]